VRSEVGGVMVDFPESVKELVRRKAHFKCCRCHEIGVEVHHIIPQKNGGSNDFDNAAPLCAKCHDDFGDNPTKRKTIKEMRDWWYEECEKKYRTIVQLVEKPVPRKFKKQIPIVFFCQKNPVDIHWNWPNDFWHYYYTAKYILSQTSKDDRIAVSDPKEMLVHLVERLVFVTISQNHYKGWIIDKNTWRFPWMTTSECNLVETPDVRSIVVDYQNIDQAQSNMFSRVSTPDSGNFFVPEGTKLGIERNSSLPKTSILMDGDYFRIQIDIFPRAWINNMTLPEWLCGLNRRRQEQFVTAVCSMGFSATPKESKLADSRIGFFQKWAENLYSELREQLDWLLMLKIVKEKQTLEIRRILDDLERSK